MNKIDRRGRLRSITLLLFICTISSLYSQDAASDSSHNNFELYSSKLGVYLYGIQKYNSFKLKTVPSGDDIEFSPNDKLTLGVGLNYKWIGIGATFNLGVLNSDDDLYGKTNSLDLQIDVYKRKFLFNANFQFYENYYWENPSDFIKDWNIKDSAIVRPDIRTGTLGFSSLYIFNNDKFSFKAAFQNTERQKSNAGSWLVGSKFSVYSLTSDSSLVPNELIEIGYQPDSITGTSTLNLGLSGGYAYTFVYKEYFYLSVAVMVGLNLQGVTKYIATEPVYSGGGLSSNGFFRLALGCNKPTHFYGINFSADTFVINQSVQSELSYSFGKVKFYYGRRFNINSKK